MRVNLFLHLQACRKAKPWPMHPPARLGDPPFLSGARPGSQTDLCSGHSQSNAFPRTGSRVWIFCPEAPANLLLFEHKPQQRRLKIVKTIRVGKVACSG